MGALNGCKMAKGWSSVDFQRGLLLSYTGCAKNLHLVLYSRLSITIEDYHAFDKVKLVFQLPHCCCYDHYHSMRAVEAKGTRR